MRSWRTVAPFVVGLALFALLGALNAARDFDLWRNYAFSGILLGAPVTWVLWRFDVRIPAYIQGVIVVGLLLHYGGGSLGSPDPYRMGLLGMHGINGAYHRFAMWDNLTHGAGIGAGAMAVAYLLELYQVRRGLGWSAPVVGGLAVLSALAAGVAVELYEYLGKTAFQTIDQGGYINTMTDLQFNILGALAGTAWAVTVNRTRFWQRIQQHWGHQAALPLGRPSPRLPPAMAGFIAFVFVPALATMAMAVRFIFQEVPAESDKALYDPALHLLLASALAGMAAAPLAAWGAGRRGRVQAEGS